MGDKPPKREKSSTARFLKKSKDFQGRKILRKGGNRLKEEKSLKTGKIPYVREWKKNPPPARPHN